MKRKLKESLEVILTIHAVANEDGQCRIKVEQNADRPRVFVMENIICTLRALASSYEKAINGETAETP